VLAVTRQGGQSFVFVGTAANGHWRRHSTPVTLGDTVGNTYSVSSGLNVGDKVIVFLYPIGLSSPPSARCSSSWPGAVCIPTLPIALYPTLAPPQVTVTSTYVGANATPSKKPSPFLWKSDQRRRGHALHQLVQHQHGVSTITITFHTGYDLNIAAVDVQNRVCQRAGPPALGRQRTPASPSPRPTPTSSSAPASYPRRPLLNEFISNYLDVYVKDALKRVPGVGDVIIFGERKYAMRIWLDPAKLAERGLTAPTSSTRCRAERRRFPPASSASRPRTKQTFQVPCASSAASAIPSSSTTSSSRTPPTASCCSRTSATPSWAPKTTAPTLKYSGHPAVGIGVQQLSNANASRSTRNAKAALLELSEELPARPQIRRRVRSTTVVGDSIHEVLVTLAEAIVIVIIVIFLFLLDWRATIIPAVTIPVSLIGTFAFIKLFGFSINSLTLFGITLATGLVVDDAIVVIENVQRHIAMEHTDPHEATSVAMGEVTSAVIATSLVLIAVFVPVSFFPGTTGILYRSSR
jgi:HAE1 family hydrophobic/amphiphilic exporter-1